MFILLGFTKNIFNVVLHIYSDTGIIWMSYYASIQI